MQYMKKRGGYSRTAIVALPVLALALVALAALVVASVNNPGRTKFVELDANLGFDSLQGATFDWANSGASASGCTEVGGVNSCSGSGGLFDGGKFVSATTPPIAPHETTAALADPTIVAASFGVDALSVDVTSCGLGDPTVYTGVGGETNGDLISSETFNTGSVPNKDEISNVYAIAHQNPPSPPTPGPNDTNEIFAGFERVVNNGDSHVDLEFLQSQVTLDSGCSGSFHGHRSQGDLLLSVDFTTGGTVGTPVLHRWECGTGAATGTICDPNKKRNSPAYVEVTDPVVQQAVSQKFNLAPISCGGWACRNANGTENHTV